MANFAKADQTDPVHRGKFVRERLLCQVVPPPPVDAMVTPPVVSPDATTRERFAQHQADPACAGCHLMMDSIGLGFEHYDAMGQWRDDENGLPIDATGELVGSDMAGPFNGAIELAQKLAQSTDVANCIADTWFRFAQGRSESPDDEATLTALKASFAASEYRLRDLVVALTQTSAFRFRPTTSEETQ
jgi:hypothetical protein